MVNITHVGEHFVNEMPVGDIALEGAWAFVSEDEVFIILVIKSEGDLHWRAWVRYFIELVAVLHLRVIDLEIRANQVRDSYGAEKPHINLKSVNREFDDILRHVVKLDEVDGGEVGGGFEAHDWAPCLFVQSDGGHYSYYKQR